MLKVIASSTCDVCFVEYADDNPPYCIPCGHISCKSCLESMIAANANNNRDPSGSARCAFCRGLFEQSGVRRLHVDLGAVPSEIGSVAAGSDDGSETVNGDEDENRVLARQAEKLAVAVANATFERDADKIKSTAAEGQKWVGIQRRKKPTAGFPVLTALSQLAVGNMENYNACRQLEQKLIDSRANCSELTNRLQTLSEADQRERQHTEKIRALEQELEDLKLSLASTERSLRTTTSSLADATASLAESDTALAAAKAELAARDDIRSERDSLRAELEAAQTARDESRATLSKAKKELSSVKHELKQLRADQDHAAPHTLKDEVADGSPDASGSSPKKLSRRRSRKLSHSAPKAPVADDSATPGLRKLDGARPKKSRHALAGDKTEAEDEGADVSKGDEFSKSGEHTRSKGHSKDKERRERGRDKHRDREHGEGKHKDIDDSMEADPATDAPAASESKPHKSGKSRRKHSAQVDASGPPERSASAPPGTEMENPDMLKISTDSLPHTKGEPSKSSDPTSPPAASGSKGAPPATGPRRGLVEALAKPALSRDGPAMRVLRRAMGKKPNSPNASHDLGSSSTVINMRPAPAPSPVGSSSSAPAAGTPVTSPTAEPPYTAPGLSADQVPRTGAYSPYPLPSENIAGFGIPGVVHEMSHHYPRQFQDSTTRNRGLEPTLQRVPRTSDDFAWPYDAVWDQNRGARGKGRDRDDRKGVAPVRHYVAAEDVPNLSASSRHVFDAGGYADSPPAYPMYEHGILEAAMPRKASFGHLRGMK